MQTAMKRLIPAALAYFVVALGPAPGQTWALTISGPFHFRDNIGPNTVGVATGDRQPFGAISVTPEGSPTVVTATQGGTVVSLPFLPVTLFPFEYFANIPFDPALTGSWTINATRGTESATPVNTNPLVNPPLLPLVQNLRVLNGDVAPLTPTLAWELPDLTGFTVTRIRIRIFDAISHDSFFDAFLSPGATTFTIPTGRLQFGRSYVFRVMLEYLSLGFLQARSSAFSDPYTPTVPRITLSGFGTASIDGVLSPGEWDNAGRIDFPVNLPANDGGGTVTGTLYVMNDATNLYLALKVPGVVPGSLVFEFDNNNDGVFFSEGDDALVLTPGAGFFDDFRTTQPPCPPGGIICGLLDTDVDGTNDGQGAVGDNGVFAFYEIAHPLSSGDTGHDFSLKIGDKVGFLLLLFVSSRETSCNSGLECSAESFFPNGRSAEIAVVSPAPPVSGAGPDQRVNEGAAVRLDGSASTGPNLSYQWAQVAGPAVFLTNATTPTPTFTAPVLPGGFSSQTLTFQLTVSNGAGSSSDYVDVFVNNVNHAPEARAGAEQTVKERSLVMLDGSASFDPDADLITYQWRQVGGIRVALTEADTTTPSFTAPTLLGGLGGPETLTFALTVSDGALSHTDEVSIIIEQDNHAPVADAGDPQTVHSGRLVTLDGTASGDPDADPIGFRWTQVRGPAVELANATTPTPSFTAPPTSGPTDLAFSLTVSDTQLDSEPASVVITVVNDQPLCQLARAVPDRLWPPDHRMVPIAITGVTDPDNDSLSIQITGVTQDEPVNGLGDGDTAPDALMMNGVLLLRAERSGKGNGRVYHVNFAADDGRGGRCSGQVRVAVPHSMKPGTQIVDDGRLYDSTRP